MIKKMMMMNKIAYIYSSVFPWVAVGNSTIFFLFLFSLFFFIFFLQVLLLSDVGTYF